MPYGAAANIHDSSVCSSRHTLPVQPIISVYDRKFNTEAFIISFAVEHSIPLSKVPKLVEFAQFLSKDNKALNKIQMDRTAATYKLKEGLTYSG